jgi:hypothetical protein
MLTPKLPNWGLDLGSMPFSDIAAHKIASGFDQRSCPQVQLVGVFAVQQFHV